MDITMKIVRKVEKIYRDNGVLLGTIVWDDIWNEERFVPDENYRESGFNSYDLKYIKKLLK
jgi:hypothetical protein